MPTTPTIYQLDNDVIDHIAAGEVVERPASVAKELLENASDAQARMVQIELSGGGLERLTVTDDGHGMTPQDARRCIERHATSKLRTSADLCCITSLGFRGEALSSIASIARVTITTRPAAAPQGFCLEVHGGTVVRAEVVGCPKGTCIDVQDLFYKTPARRKFMRAPATEQAHVLEAGLRVALGEARLGLVVTNGNRRLLDIPEVDASGDNATDLLQRRISYALGHRLGPLTAVDAAGHGIKISGFISAAPLARGATRGLWLFVNGRYVRDRMLQRAVLDAFQVHHPASFPSALLWLRLAPQAVDVNVHPQKLEVRFADAQSVYRAVGQAICQATATSDTSVPRPLVQAPGNLRRSAASRVAMRGATDNRCSSAGAAAGGPAAAATAPAVWENSVRLKGGAVRLRVAQAPRQAALKIAATAQPTLGKTHFGGASFAQVAPLVTRLPGYVLGQCNNALVLIDMAAAARHLCLKALAGSRSADAWARQTLMLPPTFAADAAWAQRLQARWQSFIAWGLELDPVGPDQYAIRAVPSVLAHLDVVAVALACLDVVLRLSNVQDEATVQRCVQARWLDLVTDDALGGDAEEVQARNQALLKALADSDMALQSVAFVRHLSPADLARFFAG